jgi:hypothetical protein
MLKPRAEPRLVRLPISKYREPSCEYRVTSVSCCLLLGTRYLVLVLRNRSMKGTARNRYQRTRTPKTPVTRRFLATDSGLPWRQDWDNLAHRRPAAGVRARVLVRRFPRLSFSLCCCSRAEAHALRGFIAARLKFYRDTNPLWRDLVKPQSLVFAPQLSMR